MKRVGRLQHLLGELEVDGLLVSRLSDIRWACGFTGSNGLLLVLPSSAHFLTDGRYGAQAAAEVHDADLHVPGYDLVGHIADSGLVEGAGRIAVQAEHMSVSVLTDLDTRVPTVEWTGINDMLVRLVASKEAAEIERIRASQRLTEEVYDHVLGWLKPGRTEKEIAAEITYQHLRRGVDRMAFDPIVASGRNSALPHAHPTERAICKDDVVLLDVGAYLEGYASDMTRIVVFGSPDPEVRKVYETVRDAQERAISGARAGMPSRDVDALARDAIRDAGFEEAFSHGLGHGVGLQVHEWPRVSYSAEYLLPEDSVVSIEPGVYFPGRFGVRIEDLVVLRKDGCENLTQASKEWTTL